MSRSPGRIQTTDPPESTYLDPSGLHQQILCDHDLRTADAAWQLHQIICCHRWTRHLNKPEQDRRAREWIQIILPKPLITKTRVMSFRTRTHQGSHTKHGTTSGTITKTPTGLSCHKFNTLKGATRRRKPFEGSNREFHFEGGNDGNNFRYFLSGLSRPRTAK